MKAIIIIAFFGSLFVRAQNTVQELLADPGKYHGQVVTVKGYFINEFENISFWDSKADEKKFKVENSLWVGSFSKDVKYLDEKGNLTEPFSLRSQVVFTATFYCKPDTRGNKGYGHFNVWPGELGNVSVIQKVK